MNLHFSYKARRSAEAEQELHLQVSKLERRLHVYRPDLIHLHGMLEAQPRSHHYVVSMNLRLPTGQISCKAEADKQVWAVRAAFSDMLQQLKKHKELLRNHHGKKRAQANHSHVLHRIERLVDHNLTLMGVPSNGEAVEKPEYANGEFRDITPATFARGQRFMLQSNVRQYINVKLERLERFVARELVQMEAQSVLVRGQVTVAEVIDEVALAALSAEQKPKELTLERWLYRLCLLNLRKLAKETVEEGLPVHLEQTVGTPNVTASDEAWLQFHQPGEMLRREDVIADIGMGTPEEFAASDELMTQVEYVLQSCSTAEREMFYMLVFEGFELQEVAHVTHHSVDDVKRGILRVRDIIMNKLPASHAFKAHILDHSRLM